MIEGRENEYTNCEIRVVSQDGKDQIEKDGIYFTRISNISPKRFTRKMVRNTMQRIKKSPRKAKKESRNNNDKSKQGSLKTRPSDIYDEHHYTLARPSDDPARLRDVLTLEAQHRVLPEQKEPISVEEHICLRACVNLKLKMENLEINNRRIGGTILVLSLVLIFIIGFSLGFSSGKKKLGIFSSMYRLRSF